jgi:hypothetical protein
LFMGIGNFHENMDKIPEEVENDQEHFEQIERQKQHFHGQSLQNLRNIFVKLADVNSNIDR